MAFQTNSLSINYYSYISTNYSSFGSTTLLHKATTGNLMNSRSTIEIPAQKRPATDTTSDANKNLSPCQMQHSTGAPVLRNLCSFLEKSAISNWNSPEVTCGRRRFRVGGDNPAVACLAGVLYLLASPVLSII